MDAIYARQSIDKADSISIESQIEFCKFETRGSPCQVYQDKGYSGKNTQRPDFQRLLQAIRAGQIKRVICYKLDRCSRSILDFANLMEEFQKFDVEFVSCTEKFDTASPMGRAMLNICIVFAQLERETIQQRVSDAYHSRNKRGFYMGGKVPFGFHLVPYELEGKRTARYEPVPEEVKILELMYSVYENPLHSLGDVVKALNGAGILHPRKENGHWTRTHIGRILCSPIYVKADFSVYRFFQEKGVTIHNSPEDFIGRNGCYLFTDKHSSTSHLVLAPHEGIIPSDIWLRCRKKQQPDKQSRQYKIKNTWLAGKIKCAKCGYALVVRKTIKANGTEFRYLVCSQAMQSKESCTGLHGIKAEEVEGIVLQEMKKKLELLPALPEIPPEKSEVAALRIQLTRLDREIEKTASKALETTGALLQSLSDRAEMLVSQRQECLHRIQALETEAACQNCNDLPLSRYLTHWEEFSMEDKLLVADTIIDKILLSREEMIIHWKL